MAAGWPVIVEATEHFTDRIAANLAIEGPAALFLPAAIVGSFLFGMLDFVPAAERDDPACRV